MTIPKMRASKPKRARPTSARPAASADDSALRERIEQAALRAFAERGFHGTSVPDIAKAARVGVGSIYRHFESKERLVNAVFRGAKARLRDAILLDLDLGAPPEALFSALWSRLASFERREPVAFKFLELQDHVPYLDAESREVEASVLVPVLAAATSVGRLPPATAGLLIAVVWGAFVGLTKAARLGYLRLDDEQLRRAGELCFAAVARAADVAPRPTSRRGASAPKSPEIPQPAHAPRKRGR